MGEGGGNYRRQYIVCVVAVLREEKGMLIGVMEVGRYGKLTRAALSRAIGLNGSLTAVTLQVEKI